MASTTKDDSIVSEKENQRSLVGDFEWRDVLIPDKVGRGTVKWWYQRRTLIQYAFMSTFGAYGFYTFETPKARAASLGLLFPGAGLVAISTIPSIVVFIISTALIPLVLFAWFGAGGVFFPILLWTSSTLLSVLMARESLFETAGPVWILLCVIGVVYITVRTRMANLEASTKRKVRNDYLIQSVRDSQSASQKPKPGSRELDLRTLRFMQWFIELGLSPKDDFSYHDVIDQFQTSAIRYQLYESISDMSVYQFVYTPNFHGYLSQAMRNCIEKSLTEKVIGFWKWESLWGKFNFTNWDPIYKDDIMVSGYVLQAVGLYQSNTGDSRYSKPGSLVFEIDKSHKYPYDFASIAEAVHRNWEEGPYCLYSCEPNWIYTLCNLVGISGAVLADRLLGTDRATRLKSRFEAALEEEFSTQDGSILPIRSELTGFTIPGLAGALSDGINSILCAAYLPHIAHRNWAFTKNESIRWKEDGTIELLNLVGADKLDPGNYKAGLGAIRAIFAAAAAEFGDNAIRDEMLRQLDQEHHPVIETRSGALKNKGLSTIEQGTAMRARLSSFQDWVEMVTQGPPKNVREGPILTDVPFPEVLVAKAYSSDGIGMEVVLYPGRDSGDFQLRFERLKAGSKYEVNGAAHVADGAGSVCVKVHVDGRTAFHLKPW